MPGRLLIYVFFLAVAAVLELVVYTVPLRIPYLFSKSRPKERLHFFTYATQFGDPVQILAQSVHHFSYGKIHLNVLGHSTLWPSDCEPMNRGRWIIDEPYPLQFPATGYWLNYCKLVWIDWAINNSTLLNRLEIRDKDLIIFTDGYDALLQRNLFDIVPLFQDMEERHGQSLFFGGDAWCWPFCCRFDSRNLGGTLAQKWNTSEAICDHFRTLSLASDPNPYYHYINSGAFIGRLSAVREFFNVSRTRYAQHREDQGIAAFAMLEFPHLVGLDRQAVFFHSVFRGMEHNGSEAHTVVTEPYTSVSTPYNITRFYPSYKNRVINSVCQAGYFDEMKRTLLPEADGTSSNFPTLLKTGKTPMILHFNGPSKHIRDDCFASFLQTFPWNASVRFFDVDYFQFRYIDNKTVTKTSTKL